MRQTAAYCQKQAHGAHFRRRRPTSSNAVTPSNAPAPVTPSSTAAAIATFSNAVENQEPVVSVDYISGTKEFTDIFEALDWIVPGVTFTLLRDTTITRQLKLDANVCDWDNITFDLNGYTLSGNFDDEAVVYFDLRQHIMSHLKTEPSKIQRKMVLPFSYGTVR